MFPDGVIPPARDEDEYVDDDEQAKTGNNPIARESTNSRLLLAPSCEP